MPAWYAGIDSDGSGALTTNPGDAIDGLAIYDSEVLRQFNECVQYQTGNGPISICGLAPLTFPTKDEHGRDVALTLPYGRIVDKGDGPGFRILPLMILNKLGVILVQGYGGRNQNVLRCTSSCS